MLYIIKEFGLDMGNYGGLHLCLKAEAQLLY